MKVKGYLTVFGGFWNYVLGFGFFRAYAVILSPMMMFYGISNAEAQLTPGLYAFGFVVSCFMSGPLITRYGIRKMAMVASPGCVIGNCIIYFIPSTGYYWAIMAEFIIALTCGAIYMLTTAAIKLHFEDKLTLALQFASCGTPVGQLSMSPIITLLLDKYGYVNARLVLGGIVAHVIVSTLLLQEEPDDKKNRCLTTQVQNNDVKLLKTWTFWVYATAQLMLTVGQFMGTIYIVMYTTRRLPITDLQSSYLLTVTGFVDLLTRIPFGFLAEHHWINRHYLLSFNVMNMGFACASYLWASTFTHAIMASIYYGLFCGLYGALSVSSLRDITKTMNCESDFLTGLGIASSLNGLSCMIAAPCLGKVTDYYDTLEPGFALGAISLLVSSILTVLYSFTASR